MVDFLDPDPCDRKFDAYRDKILEEGIPPKTAHILKRPPRYGKRFKGVRENSGKWEARGHFAGKHVFLGLFDDEEEAARARDKWAIETWGRGNVWLNFGGDE